MRKLALTVFILLLVATPASPEIWDWDCERSIRHLRDAQSEIASRYDDFQSAESELESADYALENAKSEMESAKFSYEFCTPTKYNDCEYERMNLNNAIDEYNRALEEYNDAYDNYENALNDLKSAVDDFYSYVRSFSRSCVE